MRLRTTAAPLALAVLGALLAAAVTGPAAAELGCPAEQPQPLLPADPALCARLAPDVRQPGAPRFRDNLAAYEEKLGEFLRNFCHRDPVGGWRRDKGVRDTGPFTATLSGGNWVGAYRGTHAPVVVWYSPEVSLGYAPTGRLRGGLRRQRRRRFPTGRSWSRRCFPRPPPPARASTLSACCPLAGRR